MHRIATAILIAAAVLALNGSMLRDAFAREAMLLLPAPPVERVDVSATKNAKVLSLLLILESLRQSQLSLDDRKV